MTRQQIRTRQAVLAIGAIVMLILIVIAFKGCLNARKDRAFQNYVSDLSAITVESKQLSDNFFKRLDPSSSDAPATELSFESEVAGDLGTSQGLLDRATKLDAPGELAGAQNQIELSFELRHDALEGISGALKGLSGDEAKKAQASLYTQMRVLSASDILYARAKDQIEQGLIDQTVTVADGVPDSQFLPDKPDFLDPSVVSSAFASAVGSGGSGIAGNTSANCDAGDNKIHGTQLVGATMLPSGVALDPAATVTATGDDTLSVEVLNSGDATEQGIAVTVSGDLSGSGTIPRIASGESQTVEVKLSPAPKAGATDSIDVDVAAVCGENLTENNKATYSVTF